MTAKKRPASGIVELAKSAIAVLTDPSVSAGNPDAAKQSVMDKLIEIIVIATKIDARTGRSDPSTRPKKVRRPSVAEG